MAMTDMLQAQKSPVAQLLTWTAVLAEVIHLGASLAIRYWQDEVLDETCMPCLV